MAQIIRENEFGFFECIDVETGEIIWIQELNKQKQKMLKNGKSFKLKNIPDPRTFGGRPSKFPFSSYYARLIFELICSGMTISQIGKLNNFPNANTIYYWKKRYKDFAALLNILKRIKHEIILDKIIDIALDSHRARHISSTKLQINNLKSIYERQNRD